MEAGSLSNECPSSEWDFMRTWLSMMDNSITDGFRNESEILYSNPIRPSTTQLTGKTSGRGFMLDEVSSDISSFENTTHFINTPSCLSTTQQAVIADALTTTGALWTLAIQLAEKKGSHGTSPRDEQSAIHTIAKDYYQPYSLVHCVPDVINGPNDQEPVLFPFSPAVTYAANTSINASIAGFPAVEYPSILRAQLLDLPGLESDNRIKWVQLPQSPLTGTSVGLIVLLPRNQRYYDQNTAANQSTTHMVVCNLDAGWGPSTMNMTVIGGQTGTTSSRVNFDPSNIYHTFPGSENQFQSITEARSAFQRPFFPSKSIELDVEWAEYLNPHVPSANTSVMNLLFHYAEERKLVPSMAIEFILSGLITNGLSRLGWESELQGTIKLTNNTDDIPDWENIPAPDGNYWTSGKGDVFTVDPEESRDWVKLRVVSIIKGYSYNIQGPGPKCAIAFLLIYCTVALGHCFYSGISGMWFYIFPAAAFIRDFCIS